MKNNLQLFDFPSTRWISDFDHLFDRLHRDYNVYAANPPCDVRETEDVYLMSFDLPGVKKDDIKVEVHDNVLKISGERKSQKNTQDEGWSRSERYVGQFARQFSLPNDVNVDALEANYEDGVLNLVLPKSEKAKPRQVTVGTGESSWFKKLVGNKKETIPVQ